MKTIFYNITISIEASDAERAYSILTNLLANNDVSFTTDTFSTEENSFHNSTEQLFPSPFNDE